MLEPYKGELVPTVALAQLAFSAAGKAWLESRRPFIAPKTYHEYTLNIQTLSGFFGAFKLTEIDGDLVRAYQRTRRLKCGPHAINHECGVLCMMRKRIGVPLEDYAPLPLPKGERGRALSDEERTRLLRIAKSNPNWEAAYCFAGISVNTTAGPKEVATLRIKDVDLERATIYVQPEGAKNVHRPRSIPLNHEALECAKMALERAHRLGSVDPDHYLFPFRPKPGGSHDPKRYQTTFKTAWNKIKAAAKITNLRMYDLRHHAITAMLENPDVSEETVEDVAGHVSRRMKKRYSHIRMEHKRAALDAIAPAPPKKTPSKEKRRTAKDRDGGRPARERAQLLSDLAVLLARLAKLG